MTHPDATPSPETWAQARRDYLAGDPAPLVAERHGLSERTLRRRAALEGWRRADAVPDLTGLDEPPHWGRPLASRSEEIERTPQLAEVTAAADSEQFLLLFDPDPAKLRRFAFRKSVDAAATGTPHQAVAWMRLVQLVDRCGDRIKRESRAFADIDYLRAAYLRHFQAGADASEDAV